MTAWWYNILVLVAIVLHMHDTLFAIVQKIIATLNIVHIEFIIELNMNY